MNRLLAATVLVIPMALVPLAALAGEGKTPDPATPAMPAGQSGSFDTLDANKDGRISMPEASADPKLVESFSTADKNGDGYLDADEYAAAVRNSSRTNTEPQPQ
jgi:EF hand domain-containing protein